MSLIFYRSGPQTLSYGSQMFKHNFAPKNHSTKDEVWPHSFPNLSQEIATEVRDLFRDLPEDNPYVLVKAQREVLYVK